MVFMQEGLDYKLDSGGCGNALRRCCCAGESFFRVKYENTRSNDSISIGLTPLFPAKVVPVNLDRLHGLTIKKHAFLASFDMKADISLKMVRSVGVGCFGGQGFFLNKLKCRGWAFLNAAGTNDSNERE